jgi:hypothetical protein
LNGRLVNSKGFYVDEFENIVDNEGRKKFDKSYLIGEDLPKLYNLEGKRFDIKEILG